MKYVFLTQDFYNDYAHCTEIEQKQSRPYAQVLLKINTTLFAIPLRSNINHNHVLWSDKQNHCGLDFSKAVVITDIKYIDTTATPYIRPKEYNTLRFKDKEAERGLLKFIARYKKAKTKLHIHENQRICQYSTLQYFEQYL